MLDNARERLAETQADEPGSVSGYEGRMARLQAARKRERQRVDHLVFGKARPVEKAPAPGRKKRKRAKTALRPVTLAPGVEEAVARREAYAAAAATPETLDHARRCAHRGALVQLHRNGTLSDLQLEYAAQIASVYRSLEADVAVKVASLEARVDQSRRGATGGEAVYRIRMHLAYGYWREALPQPKRLVLDMVVGDTIGYSVAARLYRVHPRRARRLLLAALDCWPRCVAAAFSAVDSAMAAALERGAAVAPAHRPVMLWRPDHQPGAKRGTVPGGNGGLESGRRRGDAAPAVDPAFLDERGLLLDWPAIADIIRARAFADADSG